MDVPKPGQGVIARSTNTPQILCGAYHESAKNDPNRSFILTYFFYAFLSNINNSFFKIRKANQIIFARPVVGLTQNLWMICGVFCLCEYHSSHVYLNYYDLFRKCRPENVRQNSIVSPKLPPPYCLSFSGIPKHHHIHHPTPPLVNCPTTVAAVSCSLSLPSSYFSIGSLTSIFLLPDERRRL